VSTWASGLDGLHGNVHGLSRLSLRTDPTRLKCGIAMLDSTTTASRDDDSFLAFFASAFLSRMILILAFGAHPPILGTTDAF
jgi:hypothetical protein